MTRELFELWMKQNGYSDINDWNYQENGHGVVYWIRNDETKRFALISEQGYGRHGKRYQVLVSDFNDFGCLVGESEYEAVQAKEERI